MMTGPSVTLAGLIVNILLAAGKIFAGLTFASQAIVADGVHSLTDTVSDVAVLLGLRYGDEPADSKHPYGHQRIHTLVAMFVGLALLGAAGWIAFNAILTIREGHPPIRGPLPLIMALVTIPLKEGLFHLTRRAGRASGNPALMANAWHHRTDAVSSLAAAAGIGGAMVLGAQWQVLDSITAVVLAMFLLVAAGRMILQNGGELIDTAPHRDRIEPLKAVIRETDGVDDFHAIRARRVGGKLEMDIHILVDADLSVAQGHRIASTVKQRVIQADPAVQEVIVHIEPDGHTPTQLHPPVKGLEPPRCGR